uniref:Transposase Tc1-like domain-containing protein n=2 Tax=Oncorhynchus tshawytscha TaxID=74940 RepID=A0AAZ3QAJ8_ONCTS
RTWLEDPRKSSKRQDRLLKLIQLRDRGTTSTELDQEWQQAGVSKSARTVKRRFLEDGLVSRRAAKKPLLSRKNIRDRLIFCKRYRDWTAEDWGLVCPSSPLWPWSWSVHPLLRGLGPGLSILSSVALVLVCPSSPPWPWAWSIHPLLRGLGPGLSIHSSVALGLVCPSSPPWPWGWSVHPLLN